MKFNTILLLLFAAMLSSCDNSLDINAPWKETPVVYAIIDMAQDSQIFRIQKTYQNNEKQSTSEVAQIADSLTFKNISVTVYNNSVPGEGKELKRLAPRKEPGFFSNQDSSFWGENLNGFLTPINTYKLVIKSFNTGNTYEGVTNLVQPFAINPVSSIDLVNTSNKNISFRITGGGMNSTTYDLIVRINYFEAPAATPSDTSVTKSMDYVYIVNRTNVNPQQQVTLSSAIPKEGITGFITATAKKNPDVVRTFKSLEYVVIGANRNYNDMLDVNKPSTSVVGKAGDYSNISNGIGVFASRTNSKLEQPLASSSVTLVNKLLNP